MVMKKLFFSLVLAFMALMNVNAQDVQLATLQKADGTQVFYGADAFKEAMEAADHGDVITLTAGSFNATTITKAVSIYGAGYEMDAKMGNSETGETIDELPKYPTRLVGDFSIALELKNELPAEGLYIEGIYSNDRIIVENELVAASFIKCRFGDFLFSTSQDNLIESKYCLIQHCRIASWFSPGASTSMLVSNCVINNFYGNNSKSTIVAQNSVIIAVSDALIAVLKNCIIRYGLNQNGYLSWWANTSTNGWRLSADISVYRCMFSGVNPNILDNVVTKEANWIENGWNTILFGENAIDSYSDVHMYELTQDAKTTYLGTDGKEIGIYGGANPFSPILTIPRVVKKDIAAQTADGKLKVNIKVETGDSSF